MYWFLRSELTIYICKSHWVIHNFDVITIWFLCCSSLQWIYINKTGLFSLAREITTKSWFLQCNCIQDSWISFCQLDRTISILVASPDTILYSDDGSACCARTAKDSITDNSTCQEMVEEDITKEIQRTVIEYTRPSKCIGRIVCPCVAAAGKSKDNEMEMRFRRWCALKGKNHIIVFACSQQPFSRGRRCLQ